VHESVEGREGGAAVLDEAAEGGVRVRAAALGLPLDRAPLVYLRVLCSNHGADDRYTTADVRRNYHERCGRHTHIGTHLGEGVGEGAQQVLQKAPVHEHLALQEVLLVVGHLLREGLNRQQQSVVLFRVRLQPHLMWANDKKKDKDEDEDVVSRTTQQNTQGGPAPAKARRSRHLERLVGAAALRVQRGEEVGERGLAGPRRERVVRQAAQPSVGVLLKDTIMQIDSTGSKKGLKRRWGWQD